MTSEEKKARDRVRGELSSIMDELQGIAPTIGATKILNRLYAFVEQRYEANKVPKNEDEFQPATLADLIEMRDRLNWAMVAMLEAEREVQYAIERMLMEAGGSDCDKPHRLPVPKPGYDERDNPIRHRLTTAMVKWEAAARHLVTFEHAAYGQRDRPT